MSLFREIPPTAGFPLTWKDFLPLFTKNEALLENDFKRYLDTGYARVTCSGTAAFYLILESLKKISGRNTVIIPSYICPLLPLAIRKAGLKVAVCDINRDNFNFDLSMLSGLCSKNDDILAVVAVHLAGIPADFDAIEQVTKKYGIFTIEDCAQALGARYKGKPAGTLGDFSFFSLCRGKGLTTYEGGVIATNKKEYEPLIDDTIKRFAGKDIPAEGMLIALLFGYWLFYRPLLFWFVFKLPQIFWTWRGNRIKAAMEDFSIDFPVHRMSTTRQLIGHGQFHRIEDEIERQRKKASAYLLRFKGIEGLTIIEELPGSSATYPFITLIFDRPEQRDKVLKALERTDSGASIVYVQAIADYEYLKEIVADRNCSNARYIAERVITLSTSAFLTDRDMDGIATIIRELS